MAGFFQSQTVTSEVELVEGALKATTTKHSSEVVGIPLWITLILTLPRQDVLSPSCILQYPYSMLQQPEKEARGTIPTCLTPDLSLELIFTPALHWQHFTFTSMHLKSHCAMSRQEKTRSTRFEGQSLSSTPHTSSCPTASKNIHAGTKEKDGSTDWVLSLKSLQKWQWPAMFSFLTLLMLPVQSKVSIAFVYWDYIEGSERAGTSSWSPITCTKPTTMLQTSP